MNIMELNDEIIKIFIESKLVEHDGFVLVGNHLENSFNGFEVIFEARGRQLLLYSKRDSELLRSISLVDMEPYNCIEFSMKSYYSFKECLSEVKKNH